MTSRPDLLEKMLDLSARRDSTALSALTRELVAYREHPGLEKMRFEGTKLRGIPGFAQEPLPDWRSVLVTGGTGCVGHALLSRLIDRLPGARLVSVSRNPPSPIRQVDGVTYALADVGSPNRMTEIMTAERPDLVVHLAAQRDPSYAEGHVVETVSTNVAGSSVVLEAAGEARVPTVVVASTGKTVRLFTSDVYAASKKLVEYQAARAAARYEMNVVCTRFTHVVDNSIVAQNVTRWVAADEPIRLHDPHILMPIQSALECYHLLMMAAVVAESTPKVVALRDLGWPPIVLLDLILDYLASAPNSLSPIVFTGYPVGYEAFAYPGTYDPLTAGDVSPLINCQEALRTNPTSVLGNFLDEFTLDVNSQSLTVDADIATMRSPGWGSSEKEMGQLLRSASVSLLQHSLGQVEMATVARIHRLGRTYDRTVADHQLINDYLSHHLASVVT